MAWTGGLEAPDRDACIRADERRRVAQAFRDNDTVAEGLGLRLIRIRNAMGWTQARCAEALGIARTYLCDVERGERTPSRQTVFAWAAVLGVDPVGLAFGWREE